MKFLRYSFIFLICIFVFSAHDAFAGSCTNTSTGSFTTATWSGTCTGTSGQPGAGDDVTIALGQNITLGANTPVLNSLTINSTFDTSTSNYSVTSGYIAVSSTGTFKLEGSTVTITGTSSPSDSTSPLYVDPSGTFTRGTSTVVFNADGNITVNQDTLEGGNLQFNNVTFSPTLTASRTYQLTDIFIRGNVTINPSASSALTLTVDLNGGGSGPTGPVFLGSQATSTLLIEGSGSATSIVDATSSNCGFNTSKLDIEAGGTYLPRASTLSISGSSGTLFTNNGTFTAGTSTVIYTAGNIITTLPSTNISYYNLELHPFSSTAVYTFGPANITNNLLLMPWGSDALTFNMAGNVTVGGLTQIAPISGSTALIDATASNYNLTSGSLDIESGGTVTPRASTINLTGTSGTLFTKNSGTFTAGTSTINLTGNGSATINSGSTTFYNLTSSGTGVKTLGAGITISNALNITNGTFDPSTFTVTASGSPSLTVGNGATLNVDTSAYGTNYSGFGGNTTLSTGSTVNYNYSGTQSVNPTVTYSNLTISNGNREVDFTGGLSTTITGAFTANGTSGNLIKLYSTSSPTQWTGTFNGTANVSYVDVRDGACAGTLPYITRTNLTNSGNNGQCWVDTTAPTVPGTPSTVTTSPTTTTVLTFTWMASTDSIDGLATPTYTLQYSTDNTFTTNTQTTASTNSFTTPSLSDGTWYVRVKASDVTGNFSAYSSPSSGIVIDTTAPSVPGTPSTITTSPTTTTVLTFTWTASTDSGSGLATPAYTLQYSQDNTFVAGVTTTTASSATFTTPSLADGTWYIHVKTIDLAGNNSAYSSASSGILIDTIAPTTPTLSTASLSTLNSVPTFTWTASTDGGSGLAIPPYTFQYSTDQAFGTAVQSITSSLTSFTTPTLQSGTTWYFRVQARDLVGNTATSPSLAVAILQPPHGGGYIPPQPTQGVNTSCPIGDKYDQVTGLPCTSFYVSIPSSNQVGQVTTTTTSTTYYTFPTPVNRQTPLSYIANIQKVFNSDLGLHLKTDGLIGPITKQAIYAFQRKHNLGIDGFIGIKTRAMMDSLKVNVQ